MDLEQFRKELKAFFKLDIFIYLICLGIYALVDSFMRPDLLVVVGMTSAGILGWRFVRYYKVLSARLAYVCPFLSGNFLKASQIVLFWIPLFGLISTIWLWSRKEPLSRDKAWFILKYPIRSWIGVSAASIALIFVPLWTDVKYVRAMRTAILLMSPSGAYIFESGLETIEGISYGNKIKKANAEVLAEEVDTFIENVNSPLSFALESMVVEKKLQISKAKNLLSDEDIVRIGGKVFLKLAERQEDRPPALKRISLSWIFFPLAAMEAFTVGAVDHWVEVPLRVYFFRELEKFMSSDPTLIENMHSMKIYQATENMKASLVGKVLIL